jgi:uncharacterized repeat protein (TIGR03803 family)
MLVRTHALLVVIIAAMLTAASHASAAYSLTTLYSFKSNQTTDSDGGGPRAGVSPGPNGTLYGTTFRGGAFGTFTSGGLFFETGICYSIDPTSASFSKLANLDASGHTVPDSRSSLIADSAGNMYGTTHGGGSLGWGSIFKVDAASQAVSTLISFDIQHFNSYGGLVGDNNGNLYGATGTSVYRVALPTSTLTHLATFPSSAGTESYGQLYRDVSGNLFGVNSAGGANGTGTIFKVAAANNAVTVPITFNGINGSTPRGGLVAGADGMLYGTTLTGGANNRGTVFEFDPVSNAFTTLIHFDGTNGSQPAGALLADSDGNLFGTTQGGGANGGGTVFEIDATAHTLTTLANFDPTSNGAFTPIGSLARDALGNLYGTTFSGGAHQAGTIFKLSPIPEPGSICTLALFAAPLAVRRRRSR